MIEMPCNNIRIIVHNMSYLIIKWNMMLVLCFGCHDKPAVINGVAVIIGIVSTLKCAGKNLISWNDVSPFGLWRQMAVFFLKKIISWHVFVYNYFVHIIGILWDGAQNLEASRKKQANYATWINAEIVMMTMKDRIKNSGIYPESGNVKNYETIFSSSIMYFYVVTWNYIWYNIWKAIQLLRTIYI